MLKNGIKVDDLDSEVDRLTGKIGGWYALMGTEGDRIVQMRGNFQDLKFYDSIANPTALVILTTKALENINKIKGLQSHPFIPDNIGAIAKNIMDRISKNYFQILLQLMNSGNATDGAFNILISGRKFEKMRKYHNEDAKALKEAIRKHLGINDNW